MMVSIERPVLAILLCLMCLSCLIVSGCQNEQFAYYWQAWQGQQALINKRVPIHSMLESPDLAPQVREKLQLILDVREFAHTQLALPVGGNYLMFTDVEQKYVLWSVTTTPEFDNTPIQRCHPIIGCLSYQGYFRRDDAVAESERLKQQGNDVYMRGVSAYSTLGLIEDPVLSTFLDRSIPSLVTLIFHELAHKKLYIPDDTAFNEGFATALAKIGINKWIQTQIVFSESFQRHQTLDQRRNSFTNLVLKHRQKLEYFYRSINYGKGLSERQAQEARASKYALLAELELDYQRLESTWGDGNTSFSAWFEDDLNNAKMNSISTYFHLVPAFLSLFNEVQGDISRYYTEVERIAALPKQARYLALAQYDQAQLPSLDAGISRAPDHSITDQSSEAAHSVMGRAHCQHTQHSTSL